MKKIVVNLKDRKYPIVIGHHILPQLGSAIASLNIGSDAVIITNRFVRKLYGSQVKSAFAKRKISVKFLEVPDSEKSKSEKETFRLIANIARYDVQRKIFIVALGGGVIGDLAGFVAAIYKRGVPLVQVPTTFLAQIDSAIGGKAAIDLPIAKNLVGAFYQPRLVFSDVAVLRTLTARQVRNGLAEAVKYGVIEDRTLFAYIEKNYHKLLSCNLKSLSMVVERCSSIKARIVEKNFGHTVGHGIESASSYDRYQHGEAIALGMRIAASLSAKLKWLSDTDHQRLEALLTRIGLPQKIRNINSAFVLKSIAHDKKNIFGKNRFVLLRKIGCVRIVEGLSTGLIQKTLQEYCV
ncbi:MAG: 3-dehydroquinate synthase [Candidatus Omnitrophica bacterium]|nr:3-dehydroquinate synthase [Candidatus Omnitrophota bacterium]